MLTTALSPLSLTGRRWILPQDYDAQPCASEILSKICAERKIDPHSKPQLIPPSIYPDMERACKRIQEAVHTQQRIGLFGDYDCDGVTAIAQLQRYFQRHDIDPYVRLPHRVFDGYGLSQSIINELIERDIALLITADTGIASVQEIATLRDAGIDTIVTDHHSLHEELPPTYATVHPRLSQHPLPHPSGSAVVFSLIQALEEGRNWDGMKEDLVLAMFGTVADLVDMRGANRALVQLGLTALESITNGPLAELREQCRLHGKTLTATDVAFRIAPRINAAGRMEGPDAALRALLHGGEDLALLDALNEQRQALSKKLYDDVVQELEERKLAPMLCIVSEDIPYGILGLIAGKLTEQFGRPSLVAHTDGALCTASLRSPSCYNIADALNRSADLLESFGGHAQAAGCTFPLKHYERLRAQLCQDVEARISEETLVPTHTIDAAISPERITLEFCKTLQTLEPFGQGNPEPLFLLRNVRLDDAKSCGDGTHLQARICGIKSIGFGLAQYADTASQFDIVARIGVDQWKGREEPQIYIEDLCVST